MSCSCCTVVGPPGDGDAIGARLMRVRLPARPESARAARRLMAEVLTLFAADPDVMDATILVTCELVTNGIVHAGPSGDQVELSIRRDGRSLIIEVRDSGDASPHAPGHPDLLAESGRGLFLVGALSSDHGSRRTDGGKVVWCRMDVW